MPGELLVSRLGRQTWAAFRRDGVTTELHVDTGDAEGAGASAGRGSAAGPLGTIVKGRVSNILPGIQSAFLEIGDHRGGFLHVNDLLLPGERIGKAAPDLTGGRSARRHPHSGVPIEDRLKLGRELLVQVSREPVGRKGARVTCLITLPGRHVVLSPFIERRGVSRKIHDPDERARLEEILKELPGAPAGFVARTAAAGAAAGDLRSDADQLLELWGRIAKDAEASSAPHVVYREPLLVERLLRDLPGADLERIVFEDAAQRDVALDRLRDDDPGLAAKLQLHTGPRSLFETHGLWRDIQRALSPRVWLKSGGHIVIEETEALTSVDVNSGKYLGAKGMEETAIRTNLEAASEIARQVRLRDLGGVIVIDFIDMGSDEGRHQVILAMERELRRDRARTRIVGFSELDLLQLTRKRTRPSAAAILTARCACCRGRGRTRSAEMASAEAVVELRRLSARPTSALEIRVHPEVADALRADLAVECSPAGRLHGIEVGLIVDATLGAGEFEARSLE